MKNNLLKDVNLLKIAETKWRNFVEDQKYNYLDKLLF